MEQVPSASKEAAIGRWNMRNGVRSSNISTKWESIESAPRDGTIVDLWVTVTGGTKGSRAVEYHWDKIKGDWVDEDRRPLADAYLNIGTRATHWMLTPIPPKS